MTLALGTDANGWSIIPSHINGVDIWVDPVSGSDSNDGSTKVLAKLTLGAAANAVVDGQDDHIILVEGSTFTSGNLTSIRGKSGPSTTAPIIIYTENWGVDGAAGGRAHIQTNDRMIHLSAAQTTNNIAILGIEKSMPSFDGDPSLPVLECVSAAGLVWTNWLIEDCYWHDHHRFFV